MPTVPHREVPHDFPDDDGTELVGMTGSMLISEGDVERPVRKRQFPFGFGVYAPPHYPPARNRHRGSVPRRA
jgi:hypothetical protein